MANLSNYIEATAYEPETVLSTTRVSTWDAIVVTTHSTAKQLWGDVEVEKGYLWCFARDERGWHKPMYGWTLSDIAGQHPDPDAVLADFVRARLLDELR